ncbi:hypothetical protein PSN45_000540 [Yamadazyma tenuis]|nr:hypothetical protein PSN45_000540 [Yamadazyma tenuis]
MNAGFPGPELRPLVSPSYDEVPIWNILPSYQLFESTFSKSINPTQEDRRESPPTYYNVTTPESSGTDSSPEAGYFHVDSSVRVPQGDVLPTRWEDTILANTHKMKRLADLGLKTPSKLKVEIYFTTGRGKPSILSQPIDVSGYEYQQGDEIHGYVLVQNTSSEPLDFDMFSVVFEGRVTVMGDVSDSKRPVVFHKFLNMFDYNASWTPAELDDRNTDLEHYTDSLDGTLLRFPYEKKFFPKVVYKKFFDFTLPERLLDCACESHDLERHCQVAPSIGLAREQFLQSIRRMRQRNPKNRQTGSADFSLTPIRSGFGSLAPVLSNSSQNKKMSSLGEAFGDRVKDLSFPDTAISYGVEVRVVGRASQFQPSIDPVTSDEFVMMEESSAFVRVIPHESHVDEVDKQDLQLEAKLVYQNLLSRVNQKIQLGKDLTSEGKGDTARELLRKLSISKRRQLYTTQNHTRAAEYDDDDTSEHKISMPLKRKQTITSNPKIVGFLELSSPRQNHVVKYIPAFKYHERQSVGSTLTTKLRIPVDIFFKALEARKPPEVKSVSTELVVFTSRSSKYPVPVVITPGMVYNNTYGPDDFEHNIGSKFKKYLDEITELINKVGHEAMGVDSQMIMDIKALADLSCKYHFLKVDDVHVKSEGGLSHWDVDKAGTDSMKGQYKKSLDIFIDLNSVLSKEIAISSEDLQKGCFTLVPGFQTCIMGRLYFLKITVKFQNHESISLKLPLDIVSRQRD